MFDLLSSRATSNAVVMVCDLGVVAWLLLLARSRLRSLGEWRTPLAFALFIFLRGLGRGLKALLFTAWAREMFALRLDAELDLATAGVGIAMAGGLLLLRGYTYRVGSIEQIAALETRLHHAEEEIEQVARKVETPDRGG